MTLKTFSNGEVYCRYEESIRGADIFIVQPICGNPRTGLTANDALMELLEMVDAAVGGSAHRVIAVCPWYGYSRQDKKSAPREPISARLVARMLETAGIDRILTMDLHSGQIQGFFQKPCDHMTAMWMLTKYFADQGLEDLVVVSPDAGRVKLNKKFAATIGAELAILNKERPAQQVAEIGYVIGDVKGKTAVLVDDIIDTAGTLKAAAQTVRDAGATRVLAAATHAVFSGNAWENLAAAALRRDRRDRHDPAARRRAGQHHRAAVRGAADQLDPPDLHGRLGDRGLPRREPAVLSCRPDHASPRRPLMDLLGLVRGGAVHDARRRPARAAVRPARPPARAGDPARPAGRGGGAGRRRRCCAAGCARERAGRPPARRAAARATSAPSRTRSPSSRSAASCSARGDEPRAQLGREPVRALRIAMSWFHTNAGRASGPNAFIHHFVVRTRQS